MQGIFLKKQQQIAEQLGRLAATELLHFDEIVSKVNDPEELKSLSPTIHKHLDTFLQVKLQEKLPIISTFVGESTLAKIKEAMMEEIELLLPEIISQYTDSLHQKLDIEKLRCRKGFCHFNEKTGRVICNNHAQGVPFGRFVCRFIRVCDRYGRGITNCLKFPSDLGIQAFIHI